MTKTTQIVELHQWYPRNEGAIINAIDIALTAHQRDRARPPHLKITCVVQWQDAPGFVEAYGTQWAGVAKIEIEDLESES